MILCTDQIFMIYLAHQIEKKKHHHIFNGTSSRDSPKYLYVIIVFNGSRLETLMYICTTGAV